MKEIKLTKGRVTLVDDEDYDYLVQWDWFAREYNDKYYAGRFKNKKMLYMHRLIMNTPDTIDVDHKDHNGLNNQRCNLRNCTRSQNMMNVKKKYGYKGVSWFKHNDKYTSQIMFNYKNIHLGYYKTSEEAALAYNKAAIKYFGKFAYLNIISEERSNHERMKACTTKEDQNLVKGICHWLGNLQMEVNNALRN